MADKFYITTSIPYVNAPPHVGFALELIQADAVARFHRFKGDDVFFLSGTDEHGMKLVQTAKELGKTPKELVDENSEKFRALKETLNASFDFFIRTTSDDHKRGARKMWKKLVDSGDIYKDSYAGLYCVGCEAFVLEKDLVDGKCPNHDKKPEQLKEENYFFKLSKYAGRIKKAIESDELKVVPESRKHEILSFINEGLRDVSFSRPKSILSWGVDVPDNPDQVMYVWCDALSNYITAIGYENETDQFKKFWPADIHVIGKDILRFHTAIWVGMLLSAGLPLPKSVCVHGFITSEGKKMSKSLNNVVDPVLYVNRYGADALRYYLLKEIPTTDDGDFSKERFKTVYETELANNIGNLVSRVLAMTGKYFDSIVPERGRGSDEFNDMVEKIWKDYEEAIDSYDLKKALEHVAEFAGFANKYIDEQQPWVLAKERQDSLPKVIYELLEMIRHLSLLLVPFVPASAEKVLDLLGFDRGKYKYDKLIKWGILASGTKVQKGEPLFARVEE